MAPYSPKSLIKLFMPHLEDLMLPLAYIRMSQLCPLPLLCCWSRGTFGQSYVSQKWPLMLSKDSDCGLICLLLLEQRGDKMYCPLVGGGLYSHKIRQIAQSALYCMCLPSRLWSASFSVRCHTQSTSMIRLFIQPCEYCLLNPSFTLIAHSLMLSPFVLCLPLNYTVKKGMKKGNTIDRFPALCLFSLFSCSLLILLAVVKRVTTDRTHWLKRPLRTACWLLVQLRCFHLSGQSKGFMVTNGQVGNVPNGVNLNSNIQ